MIDFPIVTYKDIKERYGATIAAHLFAMKGLKIVKLGRTVAARKDEILRAFEEAERVNFAPINDEGETTEERIVGSPADGAREALKRIRANRGGSPSKGRSRKARNLTILDGGSDIPAVRDDGVPADDRSA